jgi:hypothetical protein
MRRDKGNLPPRASLRRLATAIKVHRIRERAHRQPQQGRAVKPFGDLGHFEGVPGPACIDMRRTAALRLPTGSIVTRRTSFGGGGENGLLHSGAATIVKLVRHVPYRDPPAVHSLRNPGSMSSLPVSLRAIRRAKLPRSCSCQQTARRLGRSRRRGTVVSPNFGRRCYSKPQAG